VKCWRRLLLVALVTVAAVGCGQAPTQPPVATEQAQAEHRLVHVHDFADMGKRIAPPTRQPRLSWQQALRAVTRRHEGWRSRTPPQVKLADYRNCCNGEGPVRPVLAWIVVYPDAKEVLFGPDLTPPAARVPGRCPAYVVVDATSGRGWGAFQTCQPPYRG
jgi:hypothetical protein